ncbi:hypothetical protein TSUD_215940 [Trifolium subterraneum]|uniref:Uncharacterized protein n=1 Tax=Trifolium subterraneum TaxID=3900 RepID=A0A2Z6NGC7_TRISU|nr:hypothetical protein TSUD_215940 [Trifolium subterraneum]
MVDALLGVAFENLMSLLQNEFSTISGISSNARKLSTTLDLIKTVLEDAEKKQLTDRAIKVWLQQLKDAVYVLDDILDECSIKSNRLKGSSAFKPKNIIFRHNIGNRLKEITSRIDEIADMKNKFLLQEGVTAKEMIGEVAEWRQTSSIIAEPKVYGREEDKEKIVEFLLNQARDSDSLSVYPIVGLGGVGKTTLTQLVYNDPRVSTVNFHTKIWVCVSEVFSVKRILCSIIESIERQKCDALDLDVIQRKVQELLHGKRFLLVLDDVWNKNEELKFGLSQEKWNQLKSVLSSGSKGSSCLVSTRDEVVASIMGTCHAHHLSGLSENECWLLFKQYAFGNDREEPVELVEIGKEIAKKVRGVASCCTSIGSLEKGNSLAELRDLNLGGELSIKGLNNVGSLSEAQEANLMCKKDLQQLRLSWEITSHEFTNTPAVSAEQVLEVLQPHSNLKRMEIWYYEGLLLPSWISILSNLVSLQLWNCNNCVRLPSIGKLQYLKRLRLYNIRNLKYLDDECHDGMEVRVFPSLEVLRLTDLANIEGLLKVERGDVFPCLSTLEIISCPKLGLPCLPSLKHLIVNGCNNELLRSISTFRSLTILDLSGGEGITSFSEGMFTNLTFLQTLRITQFPKLKELPNQPFNLASLERLSISLCNELESLPEQNWESLQSLRILHIWRCEGLRWLPEGIRHLTSLEYLEIIGCPTLEERCKEGTGEDWDKITHIPKLKIGWP